jgi:hypothetical protein
MTSLEETRRINFINKNDLLLTSLRKYYCKNSNFDKLLDILNNEAKISLRIIDWFATNYSKKYNIIYEICIDDKNNRFYLKDKKDCPKILKQFIVFMNYKSQLKAYSKKQFDPFCRRERIEFSIGKKKIITTIGQLNFFKWAIENLIVEYINDNLEEIEGDMNDSISSNSLKKKAKKKKLNKSNKNKATKTNKSPKKPKDKDKACKPKTKTTKPKKKAKTTKSPKTTSVDKDKKKSKRKKRNELSISASRGLNKHNVRVVLDFN